MALGDRGDPGSGDPAQSPSRLQGSKTEMTDITEKASLRGELRELLATLAHEQWSGWTEYMLANMDEVHIKGWKRQIATLYEDLSEPEKDSDRKEADRVLAVLRRFYCWEAPGDPCRLLVREARCPID